MPPGHSNLYLAAKAFLIEFYATLNQAFELPGEKALKVLPQDFSLWDRMLNDQSSQMAAPKFHLLHSTRLRTGKLLTDLHC